MALFGIYDIVSDTVASIYSSKFEKNIPLEQNQVQFELKPEFGEFWNRAEAYYWNGSAVLFNTGFTISEQEVLQNETYRTKQRQVDGFALYQRIFSDIHLSGSLGTLDQAVASYPTLITIRCMLKDGMGETALRFLMKTLAPAGVFNADQIEKYRVWIRDYAMIYRDPSLDEATFSAFLDQVETAETI